jgi:hypothetical protein
MMNKAENFINFGIEAPRSNLPAVKLWQAGLQGTEPAPVYRGSGAQRS